jgi:hypothetical protein
MIMSLMNVPQSNLEWQRWGFNHARVHQQIRDALRTKNQYIVGDYILDPIAFDAIDEWLGRVQQTHTEMNTALNLSSNNLENADLTDPNQAAAWIYLNWQEDDAAMRALQI